MPIIGQPDANLPLVCALCGQPLDPDEATAGRLYSDGRQAFAHEIHRGDKSLWILEWAKFEVGQGQFQTTGTSGLEEDQ